MTEFEMPPNIEIRLRHLEVMDTITQISITSNNMQDVLRGILDLVLEVFNADRAWFLYPCDPDAPTWSVPMESTRPEWPGLYELGVDMPMDSNISGAYSELLSASGAVQHGLDADHPVPMLVAQKFAVKSQLMISLRPKIGKDWVFGVHHCASAVRHDESELQLFTSIAFRIADILGGLLTIQQLRDSEMRIRELADIAVQKSERHLREAQAIARVGSWDYDLATGQMVWSDELYRIHGVTPETFTPNIENLINLIHPDDQPAMYDWIVNFASGQRPEVLECRGVCPDGTIRYLENQGELFSDADGEPGHMSGTVRDITDRKQLERGIRVAQYSVDHAQDAIFRLNRDARIIYVNDAACKHLQYSRDELLEMTLFDTNPDFSPKVWAAHWENVINIGSKRFEARHRRKDGTFVPVEVVANCIEIENDYIFTSIVRNIADRKQAEITLLRHKAAIDTTHDGFWINDEQGVIQEANQAYAKMIGYSLDELRGMYVFQLEAEKRSTDEIKAHMDKVVSQGWDVFETCHRHKDGHKIELEASVSYIPDSRQFMAFFRDITERKQAEALQRDLLRQLEAKELAKTRFLAAAGHDLRQPLTAANLYIDTLKLAKLTPQQEKIVQRLDHSMSTFNALLDTLLNISKLDAGVIKPEYTAINISEIIIWLEQNFAPIAEQKQLKLKVYFPVNELLCVFSDLGLLKSVLINLVSNAIKFTAKGAILISVRRSGKDVLFQVWDTGTGISAENIKFIFDEFYQINNPQRDRERGLGLGLPIAKRTLRLLDAELTCRSQIGRGSVFGFRLPLQNEPGEISPQAETAGNEVRRELFARNKRFVVVEDDQLVLQGMVTWLEEMGAEVKFFFSAEDALIYPGITHADCYVVDFTLAGPLNGIEFLDQLVLKSGKHINAVITTGDTSNDFIRYAKECGWPVLHKPMHTSKLIDLLIAQQP